MANNGSRSEQSKGASPHASPTGGVKGSTARRDDVEVGDMSIGQLAEHVGVSTRTIRYYEQLGVIPPTARSQGGTRRYGHEYTFFLRGALALKELGFNLEQIQVLAQWVRGENSDQSAVHEAAELLDVKMDELEHKIRLIRAIREGVTDRRHNIDQAADSLL